MSRRPVFEPDVTLGDLLVLARLGAITAGDGHTFATAELKQQTEASSTRIRNAMIRIADALGPVEVEGKKRRTQRPSVRGRNIGGAAVLADLLIQVARDEDTDQERLNQEIRRLVDHVAQQRKAISGNLPSQFAFDLHHSTRSMCRVSLLRLRQGSTPQTRPGRFGVGPAANLARLVTHQPACRRRP